MTNKTWTDEDYDEDQLRCVKLGRNDNAREDWGNIDHLDPSKYSAYQMTKILRAL